jgi:predicted nuclease of predicted toxin-antitoxin system
MHIPSCWKSSVRQYLMAKIKFYTDENVSKTVIMGLRQRGVDVLSVPEAGTLGASDEEHLRVAASDERVIFTQDRDFLRLAAAGARHAGIVYATQNRSVGRLIFGLGPIHQVLEAEDITSNIEYI